MGVGINLAIAPIIDSMSNYAAEHPESATVVSEPGHYSVQIHDPSGLDMPDMGPFFWVMRVAAAAVVILLAAAVTRRLHDTGRAGWWGLPPVVFLAVGLTLFPTVMARSMSEPARMDMFFLLFANNFLYIASLAGLIVLLMLNGTPSSNRYGPPRA